MTTRFHHGAEIPPALQPRCHFMARRVTIFVDAACYSGTMPAEGIHLTALREALATPRLAGELRRRLLRREDAARLGALLVDLPYFHRFAGEVFRYVAGLPARPSRWGAALHAGGAIALLGELLRVARRDRDDTIAAIALGLASHATIDRALHPLINALARHHREGPTHDAAHREVEKFQSICFHEGYLGRDTMGTPAIRAYLTIHQAGALADPALAGPIREAWRAALGDAPSARELAGYGRGYVTHTRLLGSPLGRRIAPAAAKEAAYPRYLAGAWGTFGQHLDAAVARSVTVIEAAAAVLDASARDLAAAEAGLARLLPPGTIDPDGVEVALDRPFAVTAS
jgi:hypothetical protein